MPLTKNVLKPLAKGVLIPLRLTAEASATDATIQKKVFRWSTTTLVFSNKDVNIIMRTMKSLEESSLLIKGISKTIKDETKELKGEFLGLLLGTLLSSLLGNVLAGKGTNRAGEWTITAGQDF